MNRNWLSVFCAFSLIAASIGLTGCAAVALATVVGGPVVLASALESSANRKVMKTIEESLRPSLPAKAEPVEAATMGRLFVSGGRDDSPPYKVIAIADFSPENTSRFVENARRLAWAHGYRLNVEIRTTRAAAAADQSGLASFMSSLARALQDGTPVGTYHIDPNSDLWPHFRHLMPPSAHVWRTLWGRNRANAKLFLEGNGSPHIIAAADFSPQAAQTFIAFSKVTFPFAAVTVYRDEGLLRRDWKLIADYDPTRTERAGPTEAALDHVLLPTEVPLKTR